MIDTHCHLDGVDDPHSAALEPGLEALVTVGFNTERAKSCLALCDELPHVFATVGLHPTDTMQDSPENRAALLRLMQHPKVVGVGETGLDYYWDAAPKNVQVAAFEWQLEVARERQQPVVIHARDKDGQENAFLDCAAILQNAGWHSGILHCFSGHEALLNSALALGFHVSFAGNLTYKNASNLRDKAAHIPQDRLLVETDAPYLAPVPHRGKPNRPGLVRHTLAALGAARGLEFEEIEAITSANAKRVYQLSGHALRDKAQTR